MFAVSVVYFELFGAIAITGRTLLAERPDSLATRLRAALLSASTSLARGVLLPYAPELFTLSCCITRIVSCALDGDIVLAMGYWSCVHVETDARACPLCHCQATSRP